MSKDVSTSDEASSFSADDNNSHDYSSSNQSGSRPDGQKADDELKQMRDFASEENKRVNIWRVVVIFSILIAGAAVSTLTYSILANELKTDKEDAFIVFANTIEDTFKVQVYNIFEANRALSRSITTAALTTDQKFPYVKVPAFEAYAFEARKSAGFPEVTFAPVANSVEHWLNFSISNMDWIEESKTIFDALEPGKDRSSEPRRDYIPEMLWGIEEGGKIVPWEGTGMFAPVFHTSPPPGPNKVEFQSVDLFSHPRYKAVSLAAVALKDAVFSSVAHEFESIIRDKETKNDHDYFIPHSIAAQPIYARLGEWSKDIVGYLFTVVEWTRYLENLVPEGVDGIVVVLRNSCGQEYTYELTSDLPVFMGEGSLQDPAYNSRKKVVDFAENYFNPELTETVHGHCQFFLDVYPTSSFEQAYDSYVPVLFTSIIASLFIIMAGIFVMYDRFVTKRNNKVVGAAARSNAIVSSLFPSNVRDRLLAEKEEDNGKAGKGAHRNTLRGFLSGDGVPDEECEDDIYKTKPIADLFPETTILFGDIVGFTAWSSVREPSQVFTLLETIYHAFDEIAKRRRVFKVETVGDCYVAVVGLPEPRQDHAVVMARFARDCMLRMWSLTKKLETTLGPDTGDLTMRIGLHSGPVTAGVLRGERSRFQLFGDTMNTCARMESNGKKSRIHISEETANLLINSGKQAWVKPREDAVYAKGKGVLKTFWLDIVDRSEQGSTPSGDNDHEKMDDLKSHPEVGVLAGKLSDKAMRLVGWNVEVMTRLLQQIVARRSVSGQNGKKQSVPDESMLLPKAGKMVLEEVKEIITLPKFDAQVANKQQNSNDVVIDSKVLEQLNDFIMKIAGMYRENPFHNFEHASHVTMSVVKLLSRIVAPSENDAAKIGASASTLHDHTYGITSDPLTQFSCVLSALIHDLDHPGVPNAQLVKENAPLALAYQNQSIAEQNSVDIAFSLLMEDQYKDLRRTIYTDDVEMRRFRQLVVNSVMATDIVDKELKALRNARWEKAFSEDSEAAEENERDAINRKATIVIEHLIQASDVSHTMQHWHIYRKWNEHFFRECYTAFKMGRADTDPSINWYKGELGFFDFYIIPLAKKLKNCGVFGVSSDEYLNYAMKNRAEWESRGQEVLSEMLDKVNKIWTEKETTTSENKETGNTGAQ